MAMKELGCDGYRTWLTRRQMLQGTGAVIATLLGGPTALGQVALGKRSRTDHSLVVIFLRGGADGLNALIPVAEDEYFRARPTLGIKRAESLPLDGFFAFHPALAPLLPLYREGSLACLHAVGSFDSTRSHFEAMSAMERGLAEMVSGADREAGWIARYLNHTAGEDSPIRAVAFSEVMPDSLRGATSATALTSIAEYGLSGSDAFQTELRRLYQGKGDPVTKAGEGILDVVRTLRQLDYRGYTASSSAAYPKSDLGEGLRQSAFLLKAEVGVEVAFLEKNGWDTHVAQGSTSGLFTGQLDDLARSLAAFVADMGPQMKRTTVVVMTEFGRRVYENASFGTDHGRGSFMFVVGGDVRGGRVIADWPGLREENREGPGDLAVTTDYRNVLAEILRTSLAVPDADKLFPGLRAQPIGVVKRNA